MVLILALPLSQRRITTRICMVGVGDLVLTIRLRSGMGRNGSTQDLPLLSLLNFSPGVRIDVQVVAVVAGSIADDDSGDDYHAEQDDSWRTHDFSSPRLGGGSNKSFLNFSETPR